MKNTSVLLVLCLAFMVQACQKQTKEKKCVVLEPQSVVDLKVANADGRYGIWTKVDREKPDMDYSYVRRMDSVGAEEIMRIVKHYGFDDIAKVNEANLVSLVLYAGINPTGAKEVKKGEVMAMLFYTIDKDSRDYIMHFYKSNAEGFSRIDELVSHTNIANTGDYYTLSALAKGKNSHIAAISFIDHSKTKGTAKLYGTEEHDALEDFVRDLKSMSTDSTFVEIMDEILADLDYGVNKSISQLRSDFNDL